MTCVHFGALMTALVLAASPGRSDEKALASENLTTLSSKLAVAPSAISMDALSRAAAEQRRLFIGALATLLRTTTSRDLQIRACYLLGEFRAAEVVDVVVRHLDVEAEPRSDLGKIPLWSRYPCVDALVYIGKPAESSLVDVIATNDRADLRDLALQALKSIESPEGTALRLEEALRNVTGNQKDRLTAVLDQLKK